jgi:hypothetical protein
MKNKSSFSINHHSWCTYCLAFLSVVCSCNIALGQCVPPPSVNQIQNGGFEVLVNGCPPGNAIKINGAINQCVPNWFAANGTPSICFNFPAQGANYACLGAVANAECERNEGIFQNIQICTGIEYNLSFLTNKLEGSGRLLVLLVNGLVNVPMLPGNEGGNPCLQPQSNWQTIADINVSFGWQQRNVTFTPTDPNLTQILFLIIPTSNAFDVGLDDIQLVPNQNSPLIPQINIDEVCATVGDEFQFHGIVLNQIPGINVVNWFWDFGDGTSAVGQNVNHIFLSPGQYTVCLMITDNCQISSITTKIITVTDYTITANLTPLIACRDGLGQVRCEIDVVGGTGSGNQTIPISLQANITGANGISISGIEFNTSGYASIQVPIDGTPTVANLLINIPSSVPINTVITIQLVYTYDECLITGSTTTTLTVQNCGEFTCPCTGPNAYNIDATLLTDRKLSTSSLPQNGLTNACLAIRGSFQIDKDYSISGGEIRMQPGASININRDAPNDPPLTVSIDHVQENGGIHGCTDLWSGIYIFTGETLNFTHNIISDAFGALSPQDKSNVHVSRNIFDNNDWGINVNGIGAPQLIIPNAIFNYNTFTSTPQLLLNGNRPSGGIWVRNGFLQVGPYDSPQGPWNRFTRLKFGIFVESGSVAAGIALMSESDNTNLPARGIETRNASIFATYCSFSDVHDAIWQRGPLLMAYENKFTNIPSYGIHAEPTWVAWVERNNLFFNCSGGASTALSMAGNGTLKINNNQIFSDGSQPNGEMERAISILVNNPFSYSEVIDNEIHFSTANDDRVRHAINIGISKKLRVYDNTIEIPSKSAGIHLTDVKDSRFKENTVTWISNISNSTPRYGVHSKMSDLNRYCCNRFFDLDYGFRYDGPCGANVIRHNEVNDGSIGITCTAGTVLSEQVHAGNHWNGFTAQHFGTDLEKQNSRFFIQDGDFSIPGTQKTPPYWPQQPSDNDFIGFLAGASTNCVTDNECQPPYFPEYTGGGDEDSFTITPSDVSTSRKIYQGQVYGSMLNWELQRELLIRLKTHSELIGANTTIDSFYFATGGSNLDKFTDIEISIDNIAKVNPNLSMAGYSLIDSVSHQLLLLKTLDSLLILIPEGENNTLLMDQRKLCWEKFANHYVNLMVRDAQLKMERNTVLDDLITNNALIVSSNTIEANLKQVNALYLALLKKEKFEITENEAIAIKSIADQCPLDGGKAVLRARIFYNMYQLTYNDIEESNCSTEGDRAMERNGVLNETQNTIFKIQPNPTTGTVRILTLENAYLGQPISVEIFSPAGVLLEIRTLTLTGNDFFNLENQSNGIYLIKITDSNGVSQIQKLVLVK